ncbi:MAG: galactose mutarotase [Streptococcaceae bacterium]|jgi:aldose 1-epimerase|nr:galactose mutarotase [Streptococcaceae bacterium]
MIKKKDFGKLASGEAVSLYTLKNAAGMEVAVTDFGACTQAIRVPSASGELVDVVLGYDDLAGYLHNDCFLGATIGRNANRIAGGKFAIDGKSYQLAQNDGVNNLHSEPNGYETRLWDFVSTDEAKNELVLSIVSPDGDQGFPGEMKVAATFALSEDNVFSVSYDGVTDATTVFNPTNHSYFNLNGAGSGTILGHALTLKASQFTPIQDGGAIPTGEKRDVDGVFDFRKGKKIGTEIDADEEQLHFVGGYDHNYVLDTGDTFATVVGDKTGIRLEISSNAKNVQFYSGNSLNGVSGKNGAIYKRREAFCLEPQFAPDAVNQSKFESPVLKVGDRRTRMIYFRFSNPNS